jgi:hypothetical protein
VNQTTNTIEWPALDDQLLEYFAGHPNAEDTLEGIAEWWLLESRIKFFTPQIKAALIRLVEKGLVEARTRSGETIYRLSRNAAPTEENHASRGNSPQDQTSDYQDHQHSDQ